MDAGKVDMIFHLKRKDNGDTQTVDAVKWGKEWMALCPWHDDKKQSLAINEYKQCFLCHGCDARGSIYHPENEKKWKRRWGASSKEADIEATYDYVDKEGTLIFQVVRLKGKDKKFYQRHLDPKNPEKWVNDVKGIHPVLYNLLEVIKSENVFIVEGEKDVENLRKIGLVATTNPMGAGKWKPVYYDPYLNNKNVFIIPDNDSGGKKHARDIGNNIVQVHAKTVKIVELPGLPDKGDVSDWLNSGGTKKKLLELAENAGLYERESDSDEKQTYFIEKDCLFRWKSVGDTEVPVLLANFDARVVKDTIKDDGLTTERFYGVGGRWNGRNLPVIEILSSRFGAMNWVSDWGVKLSIVPPSGNKDYVRYAIQILSDDVEEYRIFTHTGWREIDGEWFYLTSSGAIGKDSIQVELPKEVSKYHLPITSTNELEAIQTSFSLLDMASLNVMIPLFSTVHLAPLVTILDPQPNFSLYLHGETGHFKTTVASLVLSHFGDHVTGVNLSNFNDTVNALEKRAFILKDALMVLDDFSPSTSVGEAVVKEGIMQRIIRAFANRTARARLNPDTTEKGRYEPRGMLVVTGEDLPQGSSTMARLLVLEVDKDKIDLKKLTELQHKSGLLPHAFSSYIWWLRDRIPQIQDTFKQEFVALRKQAYQEGQHLKICEQVAFLYYAFDLVVQWGVEKDAITNTAAKNLSKKAWETLLFLAQRQHERITVEDPVKRFVEILQSLLEHKSIRILDKKNLTLTIGTHDGELLGYIDEDFFYLLPTPLWHVIKKFCREEGTHFPMRERTIHYLLKKRQHLITQTDRNSIQEWIGGKNLRVLKLKRSVFKT